MSDKFVQVQAKIFLAVLGLLAAIAPSAAFAHTGVGAIHGFDHGFAHPLSGIDHVLAMIAAGIFAANLGGRALWAVPCAFVAMMAAGGILGMQSAGIPFAEAGIGLSVVALGAVVALRWKAPVSLAMAFVGLFAIFHGYAHGSEMPSDASALSYGAGFVLATALLQLTGIGIGAGMQRLGSVSSRRMMQAGGAATSLAGVAVLAGAL